MRVLVLADLHAEEEVLDRLQNVHGKYERIIVAGDLEGEDYTQRLLDISSTISYIPGNMDSPESCERSAHRCIHKGEIRTGEGVKIIGFGFSSPTPFGTPGELSEEEIYEGMKDLGINENTVLITHVPPYGILDEVSAGVHAGSKSVLRIMEEKKPRIIACGHVHHAKGKVKSGETTVVQVPPGSELHGVLLEFKNGQVKIGIEKL